MRNGDAGGGKPPSPPGGDGSSDLFASSDLPDFDMPGAATRKAVPQSMNDEPTKRRDAPVPGAFTEGATTVMNDEQRRQALAAAGLSVDPPPAAAPVPQTMHDEPTREAGTFSIGFDLEPMAQQDSSMSFEAPAESTSFEAPAESTSFEAPAVESRPFTAADAAPRVDPPANDGFDQPALGPDAGLPSHLQLPSIDFSLPSGMGEPTFSSGGSATPTDLPAHLQLPNFPEFDLPALPGVEQTKRRLVDDVGIEGSLGGSFGSLDNSPATGAPKPGAGDGWAVAPAAQAATPPPPPKRNMKRPSNAPLPMDLSLPQMSLPSVNQPASKKEPTLLRSDVAEKLATVKKKSMAGPIIAITVLILGTGAALYVYKDTILTRVFGKHQSEAVETNTDKARKLVALGTTFYDKNEMPTAIENFTAALAVDPTYAKAHRSLAIAYAKMNQPDKAVTHYRTYLVLAPTADDAAAVKKIVDDYDAKAKELEKQKAEEAKAAREKEREKEKEKGKKHR